MRERKLEIFVAALISAVVLAFALMWWSRKHRPSEAELRTRFAEHRADFERLHTMYQHDASAGLYISFNFVNQDKGTELPSSRIDQYRTLMRKVGVYGIYGRKDRYHMPIFGGGYLDTSWSIGYAFHLAKPEIVVPSAYKWAPRQNKMAFAPLSNHWYIYNSQ